MSAPAAVGRHRRLRAVLLLALVVSAMPPAPTPAAASGADGIWSLSADPATAPQRRYHAGIYDPLRDRLLIFGGAEGSPGNGLFSLGLSGPPLWTPLVPGGSGPVPYEGQQAIYDPVRDRMIVFGGYYTCDTYALPLAGPLVWSKLAAAGAAPPPRVNASVVYDPVRDRMILFGGSMYNNVWPYIPICYNDVWALSLGASPAWTQITPAGIAPHPRAQHSAAYDPVRDRMIVCAGDTTYYRNAYFGDVWALSFGGSPSWSEITPAGTPPAARAQARLVYDPVRDRLLFGGGQTEYQNLYDLWELSLGGSPEWATLAPGGVPPERLGDVEVYDSLRDRLLLHGGTSPAGTDDATFALPLSSAGGWSRVTPDSPPAAPPPRVGAIVVYDSRRQRAIAYGGVLRPGDPEAWAYTAATHTWTPIITSGPTPPLRSDPAAIYDAGGDRMIIFGGNNLADAWALSFDPAPEWTPLPPGPTRRGAAAAAYDPVRRRMIVSGGLVLQPSDGDTATSETWALSLVGPPVWSQLAQHPSGEGIFNHSLIYDPVRDRLLTVGGSTKHAGTIIVHSLYHRMFSLPLGSGGAWSDVSSDGVVPQTAYKTVYDPLGDRLLMLGGVTGEDQSLSRTVFERPAADGGLWSPLAPGGAAPNLLNAPALYDPSGDQVLALFTAEDPAATDADQVWSLAFGRLVDVSGAGADGLGLSLGVAPNPSKRGRLVVQFTLPAFAPSSIEVIDIAGRMVRREPQTLSAGSHVREIGGVLAPGVYLVRLVQGDRVAVRRAVVID